MNCIEIIFCEMQHFLTKVPTPFWVLVSRRAPLAEAINWQFRTKSVHFSYTGINKDGDQLYCVYKNTVSYYHIFRNVLHLDNP